MPYTKAHKAKVREAILSGATTAFRKGGFDGVSVPELMRQAGLTHGGFYAHFGSKEALIAESVRRGIRESRERFVRASDAPAGQELKTLIGRYVSRSHRDHPELGCVLPALSGEVARHSPEVREGFGQTLKEFVEALGDLLPEPRRAVPLAAAMVGAVLLARAVNDPEFSDEIIRSCRAQFTELFDQNAGGNHDS